MSKKIKETYPRLGEILVRRKAATPEVVDQALAAQRADLARGRTPKRIGEILVERKILDRATIREILEEQKVTRGEKRKLRISLADQSGVAVVTLDGRLDRAKADPVTRVLERLMNRGFVRVGIDASKLGFIDGEGVAALIPYIDESRARGGDVKFAGLSSLTKAIFDQLGLERFVQMFDEVSQMVTSFDLPIDEYMSRGALGEYIATSGEKQFHLSYCAIAQKIHEEDRVYYESKWHARKDAKQPCKKCRP